MRKHLIFFAEIMTSLVAVSACHRAEVYDVEKAVCATPNFSISAGQSDTKTYFEKEGEKYNSFWNGPVGAEKGDLIKVFLDSNAGYQCRYENKNSDGEEADFNWLDTQVEQTLVEGQEYTVYGFHRSGRFLKSDGPTSTSVAVELQPDQKPRSTGPDKSQDFLIMKPVKYTYSSSVPSVLESNFARVQAVVRVTFNDQTSESLLSGKNVNSISFASRDHNLAGAAFLELAENGGFNSAVQSSYVVSDSKTVNASKKLTLTYDGSENHLVPAAGGEMFFNTIPATYVGDEFTIEANVGDSETGRYKILKTITPASISFKAGKIASVKIIVNDENITETAPFDGAGTNDSPFQIWTESDLRKLSELTNGSEASSWKDKVYKQMADITLSDDQFTPIARTTTFTGTYNGNDKVISNMHVAVTADNVHNIGLFGSIGGASARVMKLTLDGAVVSTTHQNNYVGIVVGYATGGTIDRCHVRNSSNTNVKNPAKGFILGGSTSNLVTIKDCTVSNSMLTTEAGGNCVGGIAGRIGKDAAISGCAVGSDCTITGGNNVGGILGSVARGVIDLSVTIDNCAVYGIVRGATQVIGGIVGGASPDLTSSDIVKAGGQTVISNCMFQGKEISTAYTAEANAFMGGIVGLGSRTADTAEQATSRGMSIHVVNCCARPQKVISKVGSNTGRWSFGGISGGMFAGVHIWNCWSDVTEEKMELYAGNLGHGSITTQMQPETTGNSAEYCFGLIKLKNSGAGNVHGEVITAEQMSNGYLLGKLAEGKGAYAGGKAVLSAWAAGTDGCPAISGIPTDPDAK